MQDETKFYTVAEMAIQVISDAPIKEDTFHPKFRMFERNEPQKVHLTIHHHFDLDTAVLKSNGKKIYHNPPWMIFQDKNTFVYHMISSKGKVDETLLIAFINTAHTHADIYWSPEYKTQYEEGHLETLTGFPSDQVLLASTLADVSGCFFHANGVVFDCKGYLFMGHSGFGKSTISNMLKDNGGKILCDDRMIVKRQDGDINIYGNWCHGHEPDFMADCASLKGIFFLSKSSYNRIIKNDDVKTNYKKLLSFMIKPLMTHNFWEKNLDLIDLILDHVPCYDLMFDKSGRIVDKLKKLSH